ncbi:hypothetical protein CSA80_00025 [Candidatus Saccharibacteria bacterium]|nr:MAG: hypothetical protein CR973_00910 [Candidatus Saccharibacteria bacterium]PID99668.1 MAG: hypothetical protein CSA80_00025 [Candidatus Saccharibacteria bacterium]
MFNQFGQHRPFTPNAASRSQPRQSTAAPSGAASNNSFTPHIKPDFMPATSSSASSSSSAYSRPTRIKPDEFQRLSPQAQRAALFNQAREQTAQARQVSYQTLRNPSSALPGGLTESQRRDFQMLQRSNPIAAQKQLEHYQRTADIRYNKPGTTPQQPSAGSGLTYHRPPGRPTGPRRSFGS